MLNKILKSIYLDKFLTTKKNVELLKLEYNIKIAQTMGRAASLRDSETEAHNFRVSYLSGLLGQKLNLPKKQLQSLMKGAFLHDIGKIGISDNILLKNGKLDDDEWEEMKLHPILGKELIDNLPWFDDALDIIVHHHEKFDGTGYPDGLKEEKIPLNARLFAVIDVFDALVSKRPYKEPMEKDKALKIIKSEKGTHFDPQMVDLFCDNIEDIFDAVYKCSEDEIHILLVDKRKEIFKI